MDECQRGLLMRNPLANAWSEGILPSKGLPRSGVQFEGKMPSLRRGPDVALAFNRRVWRHRRSYFRLAIAAVCTVLSILSSLKFFGSIRCCMTSPRKAPMMSAAAASVSVSSRNSPCSKPC